MAGWDPRDGDVNINEGNLTASAATPDSEGVKHCRVGGVVAALLNHRLLSATPPESNAPGVCAALQPLANGRDSSGVKMRPYCTNPFVSSMNAVSRFSSSSRNSVSLKPAPINCVGMSL